jgi:hypothetical protein
MAPQPIFEPGPPLYWGFLITQFGHGVGLLWASDQAVAEASTCTWQHKTYKHRRQTSMPRTRFEPAIQTSKRPKTCSSGRAAIGTGRVNNTFVTLIKTPLALRSEARWVWYTRHTTHEDCSQAPVMFLRYLGPGTAQHIKMPELITQEEGRGSEATCKSSPKTLEFHHVYHPNRNSNCTVLTHH